MLKALSDPVRLRLVSMIASHPVGETCVCDLAGLFDLSAPTISYHLKVLRLAGLVETDRRRTWVYYRVRPAVLTGLARILGATESGASDVTAPAGTDSGPEPRPLAG